MSKKITIELTQRDHETLIMMLGFAAGAIGRGRKEGLIPASWKEVTDWVLIQGAPDTYTYFNDKEPLRARKLRELEGEG